MLLFLFIFHLGTHFILLHIVAFQQQLKLFNGARQVYEGLAYVLQAHGSLQQLILAAFPRSQYGRRSVHRPFMVFP